MKNESVEKKASCKNKDTSLKERILQASLEEFGRRGFKQASTNVVMEKAKVSKGLIFHYFKNKKELYCVCLEMSIKKYNEDFLTKLDLSDTDIFERIKKISREELDFFYEAEWENKIITDAYSMRHKLTGDFKNKIMGLMDSFINYSVEYVMKDIDKSLFRKDIPFDKLTRFTYLVIEHLMMGHYEKYGGVSNFVNEYIDKKGSKHDEIQVILEEAYREYEMVIELIKHGVLA